MIDTTTYKLPKDNYLSIETPKKQIVLGHTNNHDMRHFFGWEHRYNGKYKKTSSFTISTDGTIYQHFDPKYQSEFFGNKTMDGKSIIILLENDGYLLKDVEKGLYFTWLGENYINQNTIVEKRWRNYNFWCPYNEKQVESTVKLIKKLCDEFSIPKNIIPHNTKIDNSHNYEGVVYKSNLDKNYLDLNPSWNFKITDMIN